MSSWSSRRKTIYGGTLTILILGVIAIFVFPLVYKAPTCSDGIKNGDELGIDCGGSCQKLCQSAFIPPSTRWVDFEQLAPGIYNVAAYIVNSNPNGQASNVPYHIVLYDKKGIEIVDVPGIVNIPSHRNTLAFLSQVSTGKSIPYRASFEFKSAPDWNKGADQLGSLVIADKKYEDNNLGSSLDVKIRNTSVYPIGRLSVYAVLSDVDKNVVGFSKTVVDGIDPESETSASFTWPTNRQGSVISIEVLPVAE